LEECGIGDRELARRGVAFVFWNRWMFERQFPGDVRRFNEMHALIVHAGKTWCRPQEPLCGECPLGRYLEEGR